MAVNIANSNNKSILKSLCWLIHNLLVNINILRVINWSIVIFSNLHYKNIVNRPNLTNDKGSIDFQQ